MMNVNEDTDDSSKITALYGDFLVDDTHSVSGRSIKFSTTLSSVIVMLMCQFRENKSLFNTHLVHVYTL